MAGKYVVKVKDGDYGYHNGVYGQHDYVAEYVSFTEALKDFLEWTDDLDKVTLTFKPAKG